MRLEEPFPTLESLMERIGEAGLRLAEIEATEGAAGNISVYVGWNADPSSVFPDHEPFTLPMAAPDLAGQGFLVTGSGRRLREIALDPFANLGYIQVEPGGKTAQLYTSPRRLFERPTSEFNSHLAVHRDQITRNALNFHVLLHAQPLHMVYLSHVARYQDAGFYNRHILRWQPEAIMNLPDGVGYVPFMLPGSPELMLASVKTMRDHRMILWAKHGILVRSDTSLKKACDLIEYAETGARYEYLNLQVHSLAEGLTERELRQICDAYHIEQRIF